MGSHILGGSISHRIDVRKCVVRSRRDESLIEVGVVEAISVGMHISNEG